MQCGEQFLFAHAGIPYRNLLLVAQFVVGTDRPAAEHPGEHDALRTTPLAPHLGLLCPVLLQVELCDLLASDAFLSYLRRVMHGL